MNLGSLKIALAVFCASVLSAGCIPQSSPRSPVTGVMNSFYNQNLSVGNKKFKVEVVATPEKMQQGLSVREKLEDNEGMLFAFAKPGTYTFWMKDMKFNIDFLWIANGKVIGITPNAAAPPDGISDKDLPVFSPPSAIDSVLEVNAGTADKNDIKIGDEIKLN